MVDEVLFAGGRRDSLFVTTGTPTETTFATALETGYADAGIQLRNVDTIRAKLYTQTGGILALATVEVGETFFGHFDRYHRISATIVGRNEFELLDSDGYPWIALRTVSTSYVYGLFYNSGTGPSPVWTQIGSNFTLTAGVRGPIDVEVTLGSPHEANLYVGSSLIAGGTFTQALFTEIAEVQFTAVSNSGTADTNVILSQMLMTRGISTLGAKVRYARATGAGANTGWSGTFSSVNTAIGSDATLQSGVTAGLKSTHAMGDVTIPSGFEIKSVFHWLRAKNDGSGPVNIKSVLRQSGVDYSTGNLSGVGLGFDPVGARYDTDPLGTNWTQATWNAIEAGYEAET
jgi:hypothetical protein